MENLHENEMDALENAFLLPALTVVDRMNRALEIQNLHYYEWNKCYVDSMFDESVGPSETETS